MTRLETAFGGWLQRRRHGWFGSLWFLYAIAEHPWRSNVVLSPTRIPSSFRIIEEEEKYEDDGFSDHEEDDMMAIIGHVQNASLFGIHRRYGDFYLWRRWWQLWWIQWLELKRWSSSGRKWRSRRTTKGADVIKEMTEICTEFDDECHPIENLEFVWILAECNLRWLCMLLLYI